MTATNDRNQETAEAIENIKKNMSDLLIGFRYVKSVESSQENIQQQFATFYNSKIFNKHR